MNDVFRHLHMPPELACEFLAVFSRMEYALKSTPQYAIGTDDKVEAAWDRFANDIDTQFCAIGAEELKAGVTYLLDHPPRKQVLMNGTVAFIDQTVDKAQTRAQQTLRMVRTVRNNLFHGGKHLPLGEHEAGRNEALVRHSLVVLKHCSVLNGAVRVHYEY